MASRLAGVTTRLRSRGSKSGSPSYLAHAWPLYAMALPGFVLLILFSFVPAYGILIAFQDFNPGKGIGGSDWVGLQNFSYLFDLPEFPSIVRNTFVIAIGKTVTLQLVAVAFALMLNEVRVRYFKSAIQTFTYLPHFMSWVILGGLMIDVLAATGIVNRYLGILGIENDIFFLGSNELFQPVLIVTYLWQEVGWAAIIYLAALTSIDPQLFEAAAIDGASRFRQIQHVILPGIRSTVMLVAVLGLGSLVDAGFDQVLNLYNPVVYQTGDILDTWIFRQGLMTGDFSLATALGLIRSVVRLILVSVGFYLADRYTDYRVF